jgi:3D (Asp-Asp-Asp) domain-containing protein
MNGVQYGQRSTMGARDIDLHINIEDQVKNFPKYRRELINRWSGKNFKNDVRSHKYEWSTRDNRNLQTTTAIAINDSATSVVVVDPGVFNVDDVFQAPGGAQYVVENVGGGINITFRKLTGTQVAHDIGTTLTIVGSATPQGKDADDMVVTPFQDLYNFTSNFEDVIHLSDMQHNALIRGEESSAQLIARKQMELTEKLQRALIAGQRFEDKGRKINMMGGLKYMIDTYAPSNVINFGGSGTWASDATVQGKIDDALDIIAERAFEKPVMYVTPAFMRKFKYVQSDALQVSLREKSRGVGVVRTYLSHTFGEIDVVQLQGMGNVMDDLVFFVDESMVGYKAHKGLGWHTYPLARTGQSYKWQIAGVYTMKLDIPEAAVYMNTLGL